MLHNASQKFNCKKNAFNFHLVFNFSINFILPTCFKKISSFCLLFFDLSPKIFKFILISVTGVQDFLDFIYSLN